jgi:hypothetical protein
MPGLLRGVARTAVIAGTATAVSNRVSRRQGNRWAAKEAQQEAAETQAAAPPPAADTTSDRLEMLKQLGQLHADGTLTDAEFAAEKAKILG